MTNLTFNKCVTWQLFFISDMRYVLQNQKSDQYYTPVNNLSTFFVRVHRNNSSINRIISHVALLLQRCWMANTLTFDAKWVLLVPLTCMKRIRSVPLPVFLGIRNNQFSVFTKSNFLEFGKAGLRRGRVGKTLESALIQAPNLGLPIRSCFWENCIF